MGSCGSPAGRSIEEEIEKNAFAAIFARQVSLKSSGYSRRSFVFFKKAKVFREYGSALLDASTDVEFSKVAFVVKRTVPFSGSARILADALVARGRHELVIYKNGSLGEVGEVFRSKGARVHECFSWSALRDVMSCGTVFLAHSARDALLSRRKKGRRIINLWHGVAIKRIEYMMRLDECSKTDMKRRELMRINSGLYDAMIASSAVDRLTNSLAFGVELDKVRITGLPRFDYLAVGYAFPEDLQKDLDWILGRLDGRRMLLYAPTFRESGESALTTLTPEVIRVLVDFLKANRLVLGVRPHPYDQKSLDAICDGEWILDLRPDRFPEAAITLRVASALIVDYSSIWVDYLLLERPVIGFMPDLEYYANEERGFIFDLETIFPGPLLRSWSEVTDQFEELLSTQFRIPPQDEGAHRVAASMFLPPLELRFRSTQACIEAFFPELRI